VSPGPVELLSAPGATRALTQGPPSTRQVILAIGVLSSISLISLGTVLILFNAGGGQASLHARTEGASIVLGGAFAAFVSIFYMLSKFFQSILRELSKSATSVLILSMIAGTGASIFIARDLIRGAAWVASEPSEESSSIQATRFEQLVKTAEESDDWNIARPAVVDIRKMADAGYGPACEWLARFFDPHDPVGAKIWRGNIRSIEPSFLAAAEIKSAYFYGRAVSILNSSSARQRFDALKARSPEQLRSRIDDAFRNGVTGAKIPVDF
jgi:hypothetical protein